MILSCSTLDGAQTRGGWGDGRCLAGKRTCSSELVFANLRGVDNCSGGRCQRAESCFGVLVLGSREFLSPCADLAATALGPSNGVSHPVTLSFLSFSSERRRMIFSRSTALYNILNYFLLLWWLDGLDGWTVPKLRMGNSEKRGETGRKRWCWIWPRCNEISQLACCMASFIPTGAFLTHTPVNRFVMTSAVLF